MRSLREVLHAWPVLVMLLLSPFQTELLIASAPFWSARADLGPLGAYAVVAGVATTKLFWGFWFWRWAGHLIADSDRFHRVGRVVRQAAALIRAEGLSDRFFAELKLRHKPEELRQHRILTRARRAGYVLLFGVGAAPVYGPRGALGPVLAVANWRAGVAAMAAGNILRIAYLMGGLELLSRAW